LIRRILEGDKDSFLDLIQPYQRTVYATLVSMLGSKEDAEDVTQDVLLKALARLHQFRQESAFGTWLVQIAINEARMRRRKVRHGRMLSLTNGADDDGTYVPRDFEAGDSFRSFGAFRDSRRPGKCLDSARGTLQVGLYPPRRQRIEHNGNFQRFGNHARSRKNTPPALV
jgi:RNA polymerase sigma factor (sigma-70 family)